MQRYGVLIVTASYLAVAALGLASGYACASLLSQSTPAQDAETSYMDKAASRGPEDGAAVTGNRSAVQEGNDSTGGEGVAVDETCRYILSVYDGYVAVYYASAPDTAGVKQVTGTPVNALSADEKIRLATGIKIYNDEQLAMVLQDYGS